MTDRLNEIFSLLPKCDVFCDIGCDHGYITEAMVKANKCNLAVASDVSIKCLKKAEKLLFDYVNEGKVKCVVSNGFDNLEPCDLALIAGMGGEEIINIIKGAKTLPKILVVQPMKNTEKVKKVLQKKGFQITVDYTFKSDKKFYDLVKAEKTKRVKKLSKKQLKYGLTNLVEKPSAFIEKLTERKKILTLCLGKKDVSKKTKIAMKKELKGINEYVDA